MSVESAGSSAKPVKFALAQQPWQEHRSDMTQKLALIALFALVGCGAHVEPTTPCTRADGTIGVELQSQEQPDTDCERIPGGKGESRKVNPDAPKWCCP
jgi:hypothetical protein